MYPVENSATAPVLQPLSETATVEQPRPSAGGPARQVPLFDDRPKIIPFESIVARKETARRQSAVRRGVVRREAEAGTHSATITHAAQQPLDLRSPAPRQKTAVNDDVPVARPGVRLRAAALDTAFMTMGVAAAAATFYVMGGRLVFSAKAMAPCGVTVAALVLFYHLFWCVLGRESAGMRCVGVRVLTFDGHPPAWQQRVARFLLACCGMGAVGIGLFWALIDDEGLAMHDHISKTFPTEYDPNPSTLRRR